MAAKDLNIRLGLLFDEKSLSRVEAQLRRAGTRLNALGDAFTVGISAPLAALGVGAVSVAGDIESLTLALNSQLGSAEAARKELAALTDVAKNPGIGLEQAVRASVRLQGVNFSAQEARATITELGNAIASTGGTAEDLDRVTRQFAQMTSKGKVLQEDISVISESMPGIAGLMQKAFGTANVEAIRAMGVGGREFVLAITDAAKELPRVQGGIKNSIGNALDAIKQAAAKVGTAIANAFDITANAENLGNFLVSLAEGFANLNPAVQDLILYMGGLLIAVGPITKVFGVAQLLSAQLISVWAGMGTALRALTGWLSTVATAFNALNLATRAFVLIGVVTAVIALANNMGLLSRELTSAEKAQAALNDVELQAKNSIAAEKSEVERLISVINSEVTSREAKARALDKLKQISPQYFGQLREENGIIKGLNESYGKYITSLLQAARVEAAKGKLVEIEKKLIEIEDERINRVKEAASIGAAFLGSQQAGLKRESELYNQQIGELNAKREALAKVVIENEAVAESTDKVGVKAVQTAGKVEQLSASAKAYREVISDIANERSRQSLLGAKDVIAEGEAIEAGLKKLLDAGFAPTSAAVQKLKGELQTLFNGFKIPEFDQIPTLATPTSVTSESGNAPAAPKGVVVPVEPEKLTEAEVALQSLSEVAGASFTRMIEEADLSAFAIGGVQGALEGLADSAGPAFESLAGSLLQMEGAFKSAGVAALAGAANIVKASLAAAIAGAIKSSVFAAKNPLLGLALAGVAVGGVNALFGKIQQSLGKLPKFARGTQFAPGGLSLVGEQGPELMNVPRGSKILSNQRTNKFLSGGGSDVNVAGEFTVRGTDLVLVLERTQNKQKRSF